ncbi:MAG: hypothetical protein KGL35_21930 [Bradyrhizobium sp.]|nr:hypothetical protein [Bradyrhizobium sp.]
MPAPIWFCTNFVEAAWLLLVPTGAVGTTQLGLSAPHPAYPSPTKLKQQIAIARKMAAHAALIVRISDDSKGSSRYFPA